MRRFGLFLALLVVLLGCSRPGERTPQIVSPGAARTLDDPGALTTVLLEGRATEGDVAVLEFLVKPRSFGAPPHVHHDEDEYFYVLEGEIRLLNEDRVVAAPAGTFAAMTRGHLHAFWNASDAPARLLLAIAPGKFAAFFDQVVAELRASGAVNPAQVGETITRIGKEFNIDTHPELVPDEAKPFPSALAAAALGPVRFSSYGSDPGASLGEARWAAQQPHAGDGGRVGSCWVVASGVRA